MMNIQHNNLRLVPTHAQYSEVLWMFVWTLNNSELSYAISTSFAIQMEWLSLATSTAVIKKNQGGYILAYKLKIKEAHSETVCTNFETTNFNYLVRSYEWSSYSYV